ncbi:hypothetical protein [Rhodohalobacter sp.]|uniref:hypothetical protein n=1 Tax=Rhodohalobacter sp. TaxID=1974210 RepID=UPI002ACF07F2|nr:hypothetical protein [Rhodohalobacter sp.]MDZ7757390.1 hypothetical protein [Rhodohalobacter sp.]
MKKTTLFLIIYAITLTFFVITVLLSGFTIHGSNQNLKEITVERINIVEPDGSLKMVISNSSEQHPGMMNGERLDERVRDPGIIFFNEEQDEVGGLLYSGNEEEGATFVLSVDQYKNDQVMQYMHYTKEDGSNRYGLQLWDRDKEFTLPVLDSVMDSLDSEGYTYQQKLDYLQERNNGKPITAPRMFIGRNYNTETGVFIQDKFGTDRLRLYVDSVNTPKLELLDETGKVIKTVLSEY